MITPTKGNILESDVEALVNTVNCVGVMGKGLALQFKKAHPENFKAYAKACRNNDVRAGSMLVFDTGRLVNPRWIINFPTKRHWRGSSKLEDIDAGLEDLVHQVRELKIRSIAIPPLGCGLGGLDWHAVRARIEAAFAPLPEVQVLLYEPGGSPSPEQMPNRTTRPRMTRGRALLIDLLGRYTAIDYYLGKIEVQKLAYFLQESGEPLKLNYVAHQFGPYAENLNKVLEHIDGHYIRGYGDRKNRSEIYLAPGASEEATRWLRENADAATWERLRRVGRLIEGFETPYGMEMLASLHWVAKDDPAAASDPKAAVEAVLSWSERKAKVFQANHLEIAWNHLHEGGWFAAFATRAPETRAMA